MGSLIKILCEKPQLTKMARKAAAHKNGAAVSSADANSQLLLCVCVRERERGRERKREKEKENFFAFSNGLWVSTLAYEHAPNPQISERQTQTHNTRD